MQYMLLIYGPEDAWTPDEREACMIETSAISEELKRDGKWIASAPLEPVRTAKTLRVRDTRTEVTDGPFAETVEQLGGFYLLEVADMDEALAIARRLPPARKGTIEIRAVTPIPGTEGR